MAQKKYSDDVKTRVVQSLACFDPPSVVVKSIKADFGVDITAQAVEGYDPNKVAGKKLSKRYRELFDATRKAFLELQRRSLFRIGQYGFALCNEWLKRLRHRATWCLPPIFWSRRPRKSETLSRTGAHWLAQTVAR